MRTRSRYTAAAPHITYAYEGTEENTEQTEISANDKQTATKIKWEFLKNFTNINIVCRAAASQIKTNKLR